MILTNSEFYDHFRFDIAPSTKEQASQPEIDRVNKRQEELNSFYQELEKSFSTKKIENGDIESRSAAYRDINDQQKHVTSKIQDSFALNKDNIKVITLYDPQDNRFIICEKTYELQKYYVLQFDEKRAELGLQ